MKLPVRVRLFVCLTSLPVRGAWVEMTVSIWKPKTRKKSLPVRGAWVEIANFLRNEKRRTVAPRAGSVG